MHLDLRNFLCCFLVLVWSSALAVDFTRDELELVKDACLAGSTFEFRSEADGSISVKNLEGKGKLLVSKKDVTTVDLPDADKREEFKEIRACIKSYLVKAPAPQPSIIILKEWSFLVPHNGNTPAVSIGQPRLVIDGFKPVVFKTAGFADEPGAWGFRYSGTNLNLPPVEHQATFEIEYSFNNTSAPRTETATCSTILNSRRSGELTPEIRAEFDGSRMRIRRCEFK